MIWLRKPCQTDHQHAPIPATGKNPHSHNHQMKTTNVVRNPVKKATRIWNALAQGLQPAVALTARKWRPGRAPSHPYRVNLYQFSEGFPPPYPEIQNALNGARCSSRSSNELQKCDMTSNCKKFHCKYTISFRPVFELTSKWMLITPNDLWSRLHKSAKLQKQKLFVFCRLFAKNFEWSPCSG